jgi:hypothetical protein
MNDLVLADRSAEWRRLKSLVLDSVSSPITRRVYNLWLDEFLAWFGQEARPGFNEATVSARPAARKLRAWHVFHQRPEHSRPEAAVEAANVRG